MPDPHPKVAAFAAWLAERGLRPTPQRLHVAEVLLSSDDHPTTEAVVARARASLPSLGASTAWRTVGLLVEAGLVERHRFPDGAYRFEAREGHHDHMVCLDCGRAEEFAEPSLEALQAEVARRLGYAVVDHVHELHVRCERVGCPHRPPSA